MSDREITINRIQAALDEIRPFLRSDGGDISFINYTPEGVVEVQLHGACTGCSVNQMTLKSGVEMTIKKHAPEVLSVREINQPA
ncbi:MAG: NifU family protein [Bacteroidota bacterium]|nr:NifU family protein [Bacteroidota bacterium]MDX5405072.1 NifU family protein [Bacteroidota bacterium]MDX5429198.1 NifU family protein [Bacteroidota bacterium]MDX5447961.1 NifU family protein [Bacteroidota bacterium]MDX5506835.1 NifU family protein [Bacteroidota bacterium]